MQRELLPATDLAAVLRAHEAGRVNIETNGQITVILKKRGDSH